ncbi:inactive heparanase-2 isoform X1 [Cygnus olor]|uniref:inactive heparanase-2 isoform X1 n=1 Tax=Cygnus olor TaxID=8869 RepID=UPI001ADE9626|nr:inactive heparanase-2 isoform X1 [Cygnus olor]
MPGLCTAEIAQPFPPDPLTSIALESPLLRAWRRGTLCCFLSPCARPAASPGLFWSPAAFTGPLHDKSHFVHFPLSLSGAFCRGTGCVGGFFILPPATTQRTGTPCPLRARPRLFFPRGPGHREQAAVCAGILAPLGPATSGPPRRRGGRRWVPAPPDRARDQQMVLRAPAAGAPSSGARGPEGTGSSVRPAPGPAPLRGTGAPRTAGGRGGPRRRRRAQLPAAGDPGEGPGPRLPALRGQEDGLSAVPQREEPGQEPRRARTRLLPQELRGRSLDKLYNFADCSGLHLIFALNALRRNPNNSWNSSNALSLLKYSASKKYNISWELGNEPNNYRTLIGRSVNGSQLGKDYIQLRSLLQLIRTYSRANLYGPNIGRPRKNVVALLEGFMKVAGSTVDAVTWQHYYIDGRVAKVTDFLKTRLLDTLSDQIRKIQKVVNTYTPGKKIWLEGIGATSAGGMNNLSDSYAAGFLWLNTLGLLASQGIDVVVRHSFLDHGHNHLVDQNFNPLPDYWLSLLYKRLIGPKVLAIHVAGLQRKPRPGRVIRDKLRIYAHCTSYHNHNYVRGSITLYIINLHRSRKKIKLAGTLRDKIVHQYLLQPYGKDGLHSKSVQLNGQPLAMVDDGTLPELKPRPLRAGRTLVIPPLTMSFYVVKNVNALACRYR